MLLPTCINIWDTLDFTLVFRMNGFFCVKVTNVLKILSMWRPLKIMCPKL